MCSVDYGGIGLLNRMQIALDLYDLAKAEYVSWNFSFTMYICSLTHEINYFVWYSALTGLNRISRRIEQDEELKPLYQVRHLWNGGN